MKANLSRPNETFINIHGIFYGRDRGSYNICNSDGRSSVSCLPSSDMAGHNSAQVYERCQMRRNCTLMVSNDTFRDPCPGVNKVLKIHYACSPGKQLNNFLCFIMLRHVKCSSIFKKAESSENLQFVNLITLRVGRRRGVGTQRSFI